MPRDTGVATKFLAKWKSTFEQMGIHIKLPESDPNPPKRKRSRTACNRPDGTVYH